MNQKGLGTAADWFLKTCKRNPEGLLLLGAGAVLLMRQGQHENPRTPAGRHNAGDHADEASDETIASRASDYAQRASDVATDYIHRATEYTKGATARAGEQSSQLAKKAQTRIQKTFNQVLEEQPLAVALAGVATGAAIASLIPTSDFEKETIGPVSSRVSEAALDSLKAAATNATDTLKSATDERGLNSDGLKEVVAQVADAVMGTDRVEAPPQSATPAEGRQE